MGKIYQGIEELVGHTPLVNFRRLAKAEGVNAEILAKLECFNPAGSAKDRVGLQMVLDAEKAGILKRGSVIIEPTSGNTGVGLAAVAAARGYKTVIVMPDSMSEERRMLLKAHGAELVLTDGKKGMQGAIEKAEELQKTTDNSWIAGQLINCDGMYGPGGDRGNGKHCRSGDGYRCGRSRRSILDVGVCLCRDGGSLWRDVSWNQIQIQGDGRTVYLRSFCISGAGLKKPRYRAALCVLLCPGVIGDGEHGSGQLIVYVCYRTEFILLYIIYKGIWQREVSGSKYPFHTVLNN